MDLRDYVRLLRVRRTLIVACTLLGIAIAAVVTLMSTPVYSARAQLFVSADDRAGGVGTAYTGSLFTQARVKSYAKVVDSPPVANAVIDELGLRLTPDALAAKVSADAPLDTVLLNVDARDTNPETAQRIANAVATNFTKLVGQLETQSATGSSLVKVSVVKPATTPTAPVSPKKGLNLALGLLVGLGAGVGGAIARETLDQSVRGVEEMQNDFDLATLGVIAFDPNAPKHPLIVHVSPHSPRAEAFRQLRTNLQFVDVDHRPRSIVMTSSVPEEGKTTAACNLAITLADAGVPVILVEGDLRRPRVGDYTGMEGAAGLTDVLIGRVALDEVLQPWGTGSLQLLLSGSLPPNPSELLGSQAMADLLVELESRALVIIDAPPVLPVTDAAVLATIASGVVVVVRAQRTHRDQVRQAVDLLRGVDAHIFGAVFNMAPAKGPDAYRYGYGYGYGYVPRHKDRSRVVPRTTVVPRPIEAPAPPAPEEPTEPAVAALAETAPQPPVPEPPADEPSVAEPVAALDETPELEEPAAARAELEAPVALPEEPEPASEAHTPLYSGLVHVPGDDAPRAPYDRERDL